MNNNIEIAIHETQLTWLVYIIGAAIGGRMTFTANDEHDILDGDLVVRVSCRYAITQNRTFGNYENFVSSFRRFYN